MSHEVLHDHDGLVIVEAGRRWPPAGLNLLTPSLGQVNLESDGESEIHSGALVWKKVDREVELRAQQHVLIRQAEVEAAAGL